MIDRRMHRGKGKLGQVYVIMIDRLMQKGKEKLGQV
jgi:hypothetical protein